MVCVAQTALPSVSDISIPVRRPLVPILVILVQGRTTGTLYHHSGYHLLATTYLTDSPP
jgi:hypothetical protein